ncbi:MULTISPECIES: hypothetical protein [unclassified Streptomyces]|uniref:hypothetical protein n=1 Tax=unclassified Streptomyces TaxID=2593676 RepID=UPI000360C40F|nr:MULTISPECIES: hypothetical protein [unclassified Streptomyces]
MDIQALMAYAGMASTGIAALVMAKAAWRLNTAKVWKEEAEAQKARADRLQDDMDEIKERLSRIEDENKRLIELLTALDPASIRRI